MTKVNKQFIKDMQVLLDEHEGQFAGQVNYKNIELLDLIRLIDLDLNNIVATIHNKKYTPFTKRKLLNISNRCWMLWERLGSQ